MATITAASLPAVPLLGASGPTEELLVNDGLLGPSDTLFLRPSYPSEPLDVLRERYESEGYVLVKGLLPRDDVLKCREEYFKFLSPTGVLKPGTDAVDGVFDTEKDKGDYPNIGASALGGDGPGKEFVDLAIKAHTESWYLELCTHPALVDFVSQFTSWGDKTVPLTRTLLRNNIPHNKAIGVHYDQIFLRHGEPTAITAWVPIGDIHLQGGGLIYLEKGDQLGQDIECAFSEKAKACGLSDEETRNAFNQNMAANGTLADGPIAYGREHNRRWLVTAYEAGDVVLHKPHMIHASTVNRDARSRIRLGTDLRFVDSSRPFDKRWMHPFQVGDGL